ncbi:hypothetical protein BJX68DRAFT_51772 [Aspergillus pseudodeflectus]|uniref:Uncharacterized protein n=1 Tax=Aspergillus pseudodeflectus TaxID=176178 RepID=A0ABR4KLH9_9EURO
MGEEESRGRGESLGVNRFGETTIQNSHKSKLEPSPDVRRKITYRLKPVIIILEKTCISNPQRSVGWFNTLVRPGSSGMQSTPANPIYVLSGIYLFAFNGLLPMRLRLTRFSRSLGDKLLGVNRKKQLHDEYGVDAPPSQRRANAVSAASRNFGSILKSGHEDRSKCRSPAKRRCVGRLHQRSTPGNLSRNISVSASRERISLRMS